MPSGVQDKTRYSGIIEVLGLPTRPKLKNAAHIDPTEATDTPAPNENEQQRNYGARFKQDRKFATAAASLRQALQEMPEIAEASKHIMIEETKQGLNIEIVDQDGRSMFADGAKEPYERTRKLIQKIAPALKAMPYRISVVGHTATSKVPAKPGYGPWELSATAPMPCAKSWPARACRTAISLWWPANPTPIRCSRQSLDVAEPPRHYHDDAGRAADSDRFQA